MTNIESLLQAIEESHKLQQEVNSLKEDNRSLVNASAELSKKFHDRDVDFAKEKAQMDKDMVRTQMSFLFTCT